MKSLLSWLPALVASLHVCFFLHPSYSSLIFGRKFAARVPRHLDAAHGERRPLPGFPSAAQVLALVAHRWPLNSGACRPGARRLPGAWRPFPEGSGGFPCGDTHAVRRLRLVSLRGLGSREI